MNSNKPIRVLLIQPPIEDFYTTPIRLYPLGLTYTASVLEKLGCTVAILNTLSPLRKRQIAIPPDFVYLEPLLQSNPYLFKGYYRFGMSYQTIISHIASFAPDLIGISSNYTAYFHSVNELAKLIKQHFKIPLVIGGHHATVYADEIWQRTPTIDLVLKGPAEVALAKTAHLPFKFAKYERVDWKTLQPAYHLLHANEYKIGKRNYLSLIASRGCPYQCDFCSVQAMYGRRIAYRDIEQVLKEMRWNYIQHEVRIFNFEDDNLSFNRKWFGEFLRAIIADAVLQDIELTAMNGLCYANLDEDTLILMKSAGFKRLNLSFVTYDSQLQKQYHRSQTLQQFEELLAVAKRLGFLITVYVIIGLPNQSFKEVKASIDYLLAQDVLVGPSVFYLPAGSKLINTLNVPPEILNNWNMYRSSAFAVETEYLSRRDLIELFSYCRKKNLENKKLTAESRSMHVRYNTNAR